jgi:hypothetical protein
VTPADIYDSLSFSLGVRVVAGSNPAAPTNRTPDKFRNEFEPTSRGPYLNEGSRHHLRAFELLREAGVLNIANQPRIDAGLFANGAFAAEILAHRLGRA